MQAVIDWSYELLDERERTMFEVIGIFAGPVTMEAIESVCGDRLDPAEVADAVLGLVDKSLVIVDRSDGVARFGMLQTVLSSARDRAGGEWHGRAPPAPAPRVVARGRRRPRDRVARERSL